VIYISFLLNGKDLGTPVKQVNSIQGERIKSVEYEIECFEFLITIQRCVLTIFYSFLTSLFLHADEPQFHMLPFKLNLDQVPDDLDLRKIYFAAQTIAYYLAKYTGRFTEQPSNYSQLGFENLNTNALRFYAQANGVINTNDLVYFVASGTTVKATGPR
jgi:hypothetical protein